MKYYKMLIFSILFFSLANSSIKQEFPSYKYILQQFEINPNFINNRDFQIFVNEHKEEFKKRFKKAIRNGNLVIPTMRNIIKEHNMNYSIIYLSMVESDFNVKAISKSKAGGLWQIMVNTAVKELHLKINSLVDERYDPIKSTKAALRYIKKNKRYLGKLYLSMMAYNSGAGGISKGIKKTGSDKLHLLIKKDNKYISKQVKRYIQKIILMAMIGENYLFNKKDKIGTRIYDINSEQLVSVLSKAKNSLYNISSSLNLNFNHLKKINPHLKHQYSKGNKTLSINIPKSKLKLFQRQFNKNAFNKNKFIYYNVKSGDSLNSIANQLKVNILDIEKKNKRLKTAQLYIGQVLIVPTYK